MNGNLIEFTRATDPPDADFSPRRGVEILEKLLRRYPAFAQNLARAHERLKDDANYAPAMHRAAQSLHENRIRVFVSYRIGIDTDAARTVAEVFRDLSAGRISVTLADEFTARISGQDYKSEIESSIKNAHWFVFLVSEAREPSAWCMYETGMFRASASSKRMERLICIHHPAATLPNAIAEFQAVTATVANLHRFLDGLFRKADPLPGWDALNPGLADGDIASAAGRIEKSLRPPRKPIDFNSRVVLEITRPAALRSWEDLGPCAVETDRLTADLFGKIEPPTTWGDLVSNVQQGDGACRWLEELHSVIVKAASGNSFRPISATFECGHGGRIVRPIVHAMEHDGIGDRYRFHLYFVDDISSPLVRDVPMQTLALLTAIRMHNRIRWEVLHRFAGCEWTPANAEACAKAFSRIEREARALGTSDVQQLCENYAEDRRMQVENFVRRWQGLLDQRTGELTQALARRDAVRIANGIRECGALNQEFFRLALPVFEEVVASAS